MFTFHYQLTEEEYFEYFLHHNYSIPKFRKRLMKEKYLAAALLVVCAFIAAPTVDRPLIFYIVLGVGFIGWMAVYRKLIEWNMRKTVKTIKESGKAPYANDFHASFEEERLLTWTDDTQVSTNYSAFEKIVTGENALYLYVNANSAFILPHRIFASDEEREALMQFLKQKANVEVIAGVTK